MSRCLLLFLIPVLFCQCRSTHTVTDNSLERANIGEGEGALLKKFAGNWKPEDASWYAASGETDQKKKAKNRQETQRSPFESQVAKSRGGTQPHKESPWDQRSVYQKDYAGNTKKKAFAWPWSKKYAGTGNQHLETAYQKKLPTPREADEVAAEGNTQASEAQKEYSTTVRRSEETEFKRTSYWPATKPSAHRKPTMLEDRDSSHEDRAADWSLSDVRKLLNKG